MGRSRAWVAAAIGLLAAALIGMHALSAEAATAMPGGHAHHVSHPMGGPGPSLTMPMSSCDWHPCTSHRLASTPVPQAGPPMAGLPVVVATAFVPSDGVGTPSRARPPPRAGGGAVLGVWRQ